MQIDLHFTKVRKRVINRFVRAAHLVMPGVHSNWLTEAEHLGEPGMKPEEQDSLNSRWFRQPLEGYEPTACGDLSHPSKRDTAGSRHVVRLSLTATQVHLWPLLQLGLSLLLRSLSEWHESQSAPEADGIADATNVHIVL